MGSPFVPHIRISRANQQGKKLIIRAGMFCPLLSSSFVMTIAAQKISFHRGAADEKKR